MNSPTKSDVTDLGCKASVWKIPTLIRVLLIFIPIKTNSGLINDFLLHKKLSFIIRFLLLFMLSNLSYATDIDPSTDINQALLIHQKAKTHPELIDPVLGDQLEVVEWAWSPQYAKRFSLQPQPDGLKDGPLWLIGVKIQREQTQQWQRYTCHVVGVTDNALPIIRPPGDRFSYAHVLNKIPGKLAQSELTANAIEQRNYAPGFMTWRKKPTTQRQEKYPHGGDGMSNYVTYIRKFSGDLSYFDAQVGCSYFEDPLVFRNEIRFPTRIDGRNDEDPKIGAVFENSAVRFDLPDSVMGRIYPYTVDAADWTSCLMRRSGQVGRVLSLHATKTKRFGKLCDPIKSTR